MSQIVEPMFKVARIRDPAHMAFVRTQRCAVPYCQRGPIDSHHLTAGHGEGKARGLKASDRFCAPLCHHHHMQLHARGDERAWWREQRVDPLLICELLWARTHPQ
jgi:hypothetical protein